MSDQSALSIERTHLAGAVEDVDGTPTRLKADETTGSLRVNLWVWDTVGLVYVKQPLMDIAALTTAVDNLTTSIDALIVLLTP